MRLLLSAVALLLIVTILVPVLGSGTADETRDADHGAPDTLSATMTEDSLTSNIELGPVFAYGRQLTRPYTFSLSESGRRLYLNGYFFSGAKDTIEPKIVVSETARTHHELSVRAGEAMKQGKTFQETLDIYAEVLRSSPIVKKVRIDRQWIYVTWASWPDEEEEIIIPREKGHFDLKEALEQDIAHFWSVVRRGGMIAFGRGGYHLSVRAVRVPKTLEQIERIRQGTPRDQLDVTDTGLRFDAFLKDLYDPIQRREGE
jgi:hypothetical protein